MSGEERFTITPARLGFVISLLAIAGFGYKVVERDLSQEFRIAVHDTYIEEDKIVTKEVLKEIKELNQKFDRYIFSKAAKTNAVPVEE